MGTPRVIVVGAGPAGVRAAQTLVAAGVRPILVEEGARDGGQIYRRQPERFTRPPAALYGSEAGKASALHEAFGALRERIEYRPETLAWNLSEGRLHLLQGTRSSAEPFDALLIATGATDRIVPVRGWNRAGVYSLGGAQIALKAQACAIGRRVVFLGSGPLLYLVATQYANAGGGVAAVLDTAAWRFRVRALPALLARPGVLARGIGLMSGLRRAGVTVRTGVTPLDIHGDARGGVTGVYFRDAGGAEHTLECDALALGHHLRPDTQLADLAGCRFRFDPLTGQWLVDTDQDGRSDVRGVYLAGDGARILGADAAEAAGRLAALALLADHGQAVEPREVARLRRLLARMRRFGRGLATAYPWPAALAAALPDDAVVCRCEVVTAGELRRSARDAGAQEINRAKAFSRVGMGRCQGRYCAHAAAEVVAAAAGCPVQSVGRLRAQAPVKPLPIATVETTHG